MKNKKGFTLIELLAVIVILAVIALIAVPMVLKILNQARKSAAEDSTYGIYNAVQDYISKVMIDNGGDFPAVDLIFTCDSTSCKLDNYADLSGEYNLEETLEYKGKKASGGKIMIINGGKDIVFENLVVSGFTCNYSDEKASCEKSGSSSNGGGSSGNNNTNTIGTLASHVQVGDYIEYDPTLGVTETSLLRYTSPRGTLKVTDGTTVLIREEGSRESVSYNGAYKLIDANGNFVTDGYTVESDSHGSGSNYSQSFAATSSNKIWRVLSVDTETGVVRITLENEIKTTDSKNYYLSDLRGYKNGVSELNNISSIFGHGEGAASAQSITVEDVNTLAGYDPVTNATNYNQPITVGDGTTSYGTWNKTSYWYYGSDYPGKSEDKAKIYEMLIKKNNTTWREYWLASTSISGSSERIYFTFMTVGGGAVHSGVMWDLMSDGRERRYAYDSGVTFANVRPVVTLQPNVNYKSGDGTSSASDKIIKFQ